MATSNDCIDRLFRNARTHSAWLDKPIADDTLHDLYDALKWGPTSANTSPARFVFLRTPKAKERLRPSLAPGNVEKTMTAPVTVIIAYDLRFYEKLPKLFPHNPGMKDLFAANPALIEPTARRNSSLGMSSVSRLISRQKASSACVALPGWAAMIAALNAPIETPATRSAWIFRSSRALTTPHSKAPRAPPP